MFKGKLLSWFSFHVLVIVLVVIDLLDKRKVEKVMKVRSAIYRTLLYVLSALLFDVGILYFKGPSQAVQFITGYLIEMSLSVDNLFVFLSLFSAFAIPVRCQQKILTWGILGAFVMRALFVLLGFTLFNNFHWINYVFGIVLVVTGFQTLLQSKERKNPNENFIVRAAKRSRLFTDDLSEGKFVVKKKNQYLFTPLFLVLVLIETTDLVFALDSIPAVLAVTRDLFIAYSSNIFAILGLRSLYFVIAGSMQKFEFLKFGISGILIFIGIKLSLEHYLKISNIISLGIVFSFLTISIIFSIYKKKRKNVNHTE